MTWAGDRWKLSLGSIAALAFALRIWHLGARSLWMDEGDSVGFARMSWLAFFHLLNVREVNMALYYVFLRGWLHLGDSEFFLRLPSVIFGTAAIVVTCIFAARVLSRPVAVIAGILMTFNVLALRYDREVRSYALLLLCTAWSWLAYERAVRGGTRRDLVVWTLISVLGVYAHMFAALAFLSQVVCLAFAGIDAERRKSFAAATAAYFALISPLIVIVLRMPQDPLLWVHPLGREGFSIFAKDFFNGGAMQTAIALLLLAASVVILALAPREQRWSISTAVLGALVPILVTALVSLVKPTFIARYLLVALPSYAIAIAIPLARLPRKALTVAAVCVIVLLGLPLLRDYEREPAENDFRGAVAFIVERAQPGDVIMIWEPLSRPAVEYYVSRQPTGRPFPEIIFPGEQRPLVAEDVFAKPVPREIDALCDRYDRVWILYNVDFPPDQYYIWHTFFVRRVSQHHHLVSRIAIKGRAGIQVMEYVRP